jgi:MerR family copper efflux transcriptional regulator
MRISVVARRAGLHSSAIRYYEAHGLLRSRRLPSGYRVYDEEAIAALRFLRRAQGFGIALKEIKELLDLSSRGHRPCPRVRELARHHLQEVELKLRQLKSLRQNLRRLLNRRVGDRVGTEICPMIERAENPTAPRGIESVSRSP